MSYWRDSVSLFKREVSLHNDIVLAQGDLAVALSDAGRSEEAIHHFRLGLRLDPDDKGLHYNLGSELALMGKNAEAEHHFREALSKSSPHVGPPEEEIRNNLGGVLLEQGKLAEASLQFQEAIAKNPSYAKAYLNYGAVAQKQGQTGLAYTNFCKALQLDPDWPEALDKMAGLLSGNVGPEWRDLARASELSRRVNNLTRHESPAYLETLAAIYAAQGDYTNAVATAESARSRAQALGLQSLAAELEQRLTDYKAGRNPAR
jgi:Tfp pilus assembly protein PilF